MATRQLVEGLQTHQDNNEYFLIKDPAELEKINPDLIHYPFFDLFFKTLPPRGKIPVVVTVHDVTPLVLPDLFPKGIKGWLKLQSQKRNLQKVDKIVTDSLCSKRDIARHLTIPDDKIEVVYLACDPIYKRVEDAQMLQTIKQKYTLPDNYLIKVGDINPHKNFHTLFDALARTPDVHLVLVGKALDATTAPMIPELKEIMLGIKYFSLEKRVHILGFVPTEDMPSLYTLARATVQNSLYEGFGLPALESMACGTPVISADSGSLPEIVGHTGILIDPRDVRQTVRAIDTIMQTDREGYATLQQKALEQSKKFSIKKMIDEMVFVYESLQTIHS
jgi:glycosyltransferase involved in cell wall biosynthesis